MGTGNKKYTNDGLSHQNGPPKNGPAGPILAEKLVPRTTFAAKIGPNRLAMYRAY